MISSDLQECLPIIKILPKIRGVALRKQFLSDQYKNDRKIYKALKEIVTNVVHKNITLSDACKKSLLRFKRAIIEFIHDKNKKREKKHLIQSGGYIHFMIPAVLELLSSVLSDGAS